MIKLQRVYVQRRLKENRWDEGMVQATFIISPFVLSPSMHPTRWRRAYGPGRARNEFPRAAI
jgi:hypothetical protein